MIAFMCNHIFHERCIESDTGARDKQYFCTVCKNKNSAAVAKRSQFMQNANESEKFYKDLSSRSSKVNVVAEYFGKGMFVDLTDQNTVPSRAMGAEVAALMSKL